MGNKLTESVFLNSTNIDKAKTIVSWGIIPGEIDSVDLLHAKIMVEGYKQGQVAEQDRHPRKDWVTSEKIVKEHEGTEYWKSKYRALKSSCYQLGVDHQRLKKNFIKIEQRLKDVRKKINILVESRERK